MLKIGVLGAGHLGKIHIKCIQQSDAFDLVGFYDPDEKQCKLVAEKYGVNPFTSYQELINAVDVVDIVTPTVTHYQLATHAVSMGKHVFIEKPVTHTPEEAMLLLEQSQEQGVKIQVGHVERFNPAFLALGDKSVNPMFLEAHRLATFNPRGTDVSVVLDLMIHDLDLVLSLVPAPVKYVSASGVAVLSDTPDISNARIEFENGCVANLTASRMSLKQMRKLRLFQQDAYISLDFLEKNAQIVRLFDKTDQPPNAEQMMELETARGTKLLHVEMPSIEPVNAIQMELESFAQSISENTPPKVGIEDGYRALEVAYRILAEIDARKAAYDAKKS